MKKLLISGLALLLLFNSCSKSSVDSSCNSTYDACAVKAPQAEMDSVTNYLNAQGITDTAKHCSGMFYKIDSVGTGKTPGICSSIVISYQGHLTNGVVFAQPGSLQNILDNFIAGFKNGIPLIKEGGGIHLYIPPSLAYGSQAMPGIPANSVLIFDVKLLSVQ
ncbi:MAG: hypothetical protein JWM28_568 [Chitinophagaceae bacterium]|nr:hypothetical protein [Chitinophagaceae bacterium]